ncbi:aspartate kinase [Colidextribacter sp. 210702-DFI.3.9]|uniref:Aspartokinase n=1 Tax=Flintibacter faecis TaxID=2763047 RepID=A0A8J6J6Y9_9FIRM|nr:aspartate kinase [Flintibacter faecis]MBC5718017.1 aspartate kinase [Flintibacter faecis]MCB6501450.1 aspartate kinase [Colidextribacter sp. 210702-DFI.3.9]MCG4468498.1 aspartate kinase [Lawsonibacter sp. DFI.6.74]MCG4772789.1 aspartate kinase [Lawsonibacter sp. DFI.5.51]
MSLIVQKFGGTSVADADRIRNVARIITETYRKGHSVVAVLSAQGDTTDDLIEKAQEINPSASKREMDMLLATGEQISISLCAMAIERMGYQAVSLTGWQAGMLTDSSYSSARIKRIRTERIQKELDKKKIVLVAGFQGINKYDDITTLGRGGSDTSAVALAAALHADLCQIYTDVDGVYTADPRHVTGARKLDEITFDEMLELASLGAQVLHNRSVEMAKRYNVNMEVLSSFSGKPGTKVKEVVKTMEKIHVSGVAKDKNVARLALVGLADQPGIAFKIFSLLAKKDINVDIILQSIGRDESKDISFTVARDDAQTAKAILEELKESIGFKSIQVDDHVAKVSIVGAGMAHNAGVASKMFEALYSAGINIQMISTSEIKVSVLVDERDADRAVQAIHDRFFSEFGNA